MCYENGQLFGKITELADLIVMHKNTNTDFAQGCRGGGRW